MVLRRNRREIDDFEGYEELGRIASIESELTTLDRLSRQKKYRE